MKTRGDVIAEYASAFGKPDRMKEAAAVLLERMAFLFSIAAVEEDMKICCIAEEIDNIICGYMEGGARA